MADERFGRGRRTRSAHSGESGAPAGQQDRAQRSAGLLAKLLVVLAIVLMAAGLALGFLAGPREPDAAEQPPQATTRDEGGSPDLGPAGFLPDAGRPAGERGEPGADATSAGDPESAPANPWSPALFRVGFSFFIGFAIAFALRSFIKLTLVAVGFFAMALLGMQYAGFLEVNWTLIGERYDTLGAWLSGQFSSFQNFVAGELPAAASAMAGLAFGFRAR